jgi:hypothetical protein
MTKKTGHIITAVIIGLGLLWLSQTTSFAQEPITEIYATRAIFYCASSTGQWTPVYTDTYATGPADGNVAGWLYEAGSSACYNGNMFTPSPTLNFCRAESYQPDTRPNWFARMTVVGMTG